MIKKTAYDLNSLFLDKTIIGDTALVKSRNSEDSGSLLNPQDTSYDVFMREISNLLFHKHVLTTGHVIAPPLVAKELKKAYHTIRNIYLKNRTALNHLFECTPDYKIFIERTRQLKDASRCLSNAAQKNAKRNIVPKDAVCMQLEHLVSKLNSEKIPSETDIEVFRYGIYHAQNRPTIIRTCDFDIATLGNIYYKRVALPFPLEVFVSIGTDYSEGVLFEYIPLE
ncbi:MAG: hypothetical protein ACMXYK_01470 [Candidatus Woesearchaeota archaeon]